MLAHWSSFSGIAHGRILALKGYCDRQYPPESNAGSTQRNELDQLIIYGAATEFLNEAAQAAAKLFKNDDWYNSKNSVE